MKGTIDASIENAEQLILNDGKEIAEHTTTSQLLVEELELIAHNVTIKRFRYIDQIVAHKRTLLQVSSEIEGELPTDYRSKMGDILFALLPAVSITGSPKLKHKNTYAGRNHQEDIIVELRDMCFHRSSATY